LTGLLALALTAGCGAGSDTAASQKVIATVNGVSVYESEFDDWYLQFWGGQEGKNQYEDMYDQYRSNYLVGYVEQVALLQRAASDGVTITEEAVEVEVDRYKQQFQNSEGALDQEAFEADLKQKGFTEKSLATYFEHNMILQALYEKVTQNVTVDAADIQAYYEENKDLFSSKEMVKTRNIVVATEQEAQKIIEMLDEGSDFAELAMARSSDPSAKENGGDIPEFTEDGPYVQPYKDAAFALRQPGDYTKEPVKSDFGYHVILLENKIPAYDKTLEEARVEIESNLLAERKQSVFAEYYDEVVASSDIQYTVDPSAGEGQTTSQTTSQTTEGEVEEEAPLQ
jgi:parvulin-like peptidyl-prolyl isomerase